MNNRYIKRRVGITLLLLILVLIFTVQNAAIIDVRLLKWTLQTPRVILIFAIFIAGFIVGWSSPAIYRMIKG